MIIQKKFLRVNQYDAPLSNAQEMPNKLKGLSIVGLAVVTVWLLFWPSRLVDPHNVGLFILEQVYGFAPGRWFISTLDYKAHELEQLRADKSQLTATERRLAGPDLSETAHSWPASRINTEIWTFPGTRIQDRYLDQDEDEREFRGWAPMDPNMDGLFLNPAFLDPVTPPDHVSIAYLVMVHSMETVKGAIDLIDTIYQPRDLYYIHADLAIPMDAFELLHSHFVSYANVFFARKRMKTMWGTAAIIEAELDLFMMAVEFNLERFPNYFPNLGQDGKMPRPWRAKATMYTENGEADAEDSDSAHAHQGFNTKPGVAPDGLPAYPWKFAINLCGATFPIKSDAVIRDRLGRLPSFSNIVFTHYVQRICAYGATVTRDLPAEPCYKTRARCMDPACSRMTLTPENGIPVKGHQWFLISFYFAWHLYQAFKEPMSILSQWREFFKVTFVPDELTFGTLVISSPFKGTTLFMDAKNPHVEPDRIIGTHYADWSTVCKSYRNDRLYFSPCVLGKNDLGVLVNSNYLFARKIKLHEPLRDMLREIIASPLRELPQATYDFAYITSICLITVLLLFGFVFVLRARWLFIESAEKKGFMLHPEEDQKDMTHQIAKVRRRKPSALME